MSARMRRHAASQPLLLLAIAAVTAGAPPLPAQDARPQSAFVSPAWLADRLGKEPALVVLQVGREQSDFATAHLPGARFLSFESISRSSPGATLELPPHAQLDSALEAVGVSDASRVVLYGPGGMSAPGVARAFMTLEYAGLAGRVSILDGGLTAWTQAGHRTESGESSAVDRGTLTLRPNPDLVVDAAWVQRNGERPTAELLDARTPNFYSGASDGGMPRPGHIPGAKNVPFSSLLDAGGMLKDPATLRAMFDAAGVKPGQAVVTYCHIGLQASLLYAVARHLGHDAHLYDGSFEDWSAREGMPVEASERP